MVTSLIALLVIGTGESFRVGPITLDRALLQLTAVSGERLTTTSELKREIVMVRANKTTWAEVKKRLARVCAAQWESRDGGWVLERPPKMTQALRSEAIRLRAGVLQGELEKANGKVAKWSPAYLTNLLVSMAGLAEKAYQDRSGNSGPIDALIGSGKSGPAGRALLRILARIDPRDLAALKPDSTAVYSDQPTLMEIRLPVSASELLRDFNAEQADFAAGIATRTDLFRPVDFLDPRFSASTDDGPATRFVLTLRRYFAGPISASLAAVGTDGRILATGSMTLGADTALVPQPPSVRTEPLKIDQQAHEFESIYKLLSGRTSGDSSRREEVLKLLKAWIPKFARPDLNEPMEFVVGRGLGETADTLGLNLVADLPDTLLNYTLPSDSDKTTTSSFISGVTNLGRMTTARLGDGWLEITATEPVTVSDDRIARPTLGQLVRNIDSKKIALLDDVAEYAAGVPSSLCLKSIDSAYASLYGTGSYGSGAGLANYYYVPVLRIWGALTPDQRRTLRSGGTVSVGNLSGDAKFWLGRYIYGIPRAGSTNFVTPFTVSPDSRERRNIRSSPFEALPNGIPDSTAISAERPQRIFFKVTLKGTAEPLDTTPEMLGRLMGGTGQPLTGADSTIVSISVGTTEVIRLNFDFGRGVHAWTEIGDDPASWTGPTRYEELSEPLRKMIEAGYAVGVERRNSEDSKAGTRTIPPF